jgi:hypothetical protein
MRSGAKGRQIPGPGLITCLAVEGRTWFVSLWGSRNAKGPPKRAFERRNSAAWAFAASDAGSQEPAAA